MAALLSQIVQLFVCLGFFIPLEKFSLMETSPLPVTKHDNTYLVMQNSAKKYFVINTVTIYNLNFHYIQYTVRLKFKNNLAINLYQIK